MSKFSEYVKNQCNIDCPVPNNNQPQDPCTTKVKIRPDDHKEAKSETKSDDTSVQERWLSHEAERACHEVNQSEAGCEVQGEWMVCTCFLDTGALPNIAVTGVEQ